MNEQAKIQAAGIGLAVATAVGCVAYERLVKNFQYASIAFFVSTSYLLPFFIATYFTDYTSIREDVAKLGSHKLSLLLFYLSGITSLLWYIVTRKQSVMVGALFEVKYIVVLAVFYICFGTGRLTWNVVTGMVLAMVSVYLISKPDSA